MLSQPTHAYKLILKSHFIALSASLLLSLPCNAEIYKWTDDNGNTYYSDIKPNEAPSKKLNIKSNNQSKERASPQSTAEALDERKSKELEARAKTLKLETEQRELNSLCNKSKNDLKTLQENSRIKTNENGEIRYLNPEEIEQKKQSYMKLISENCSK